MADIVLINPKFEVSYWGMEYALPDLGKRADLPVAALPLLAALTLAGHPVTLIDDKVEPIDFRRCASADIVGVTGMSVQRYRMTEILTTLKALFTRPHVIRLTEILSPGRAQLLRKVTHAKPQARAPHSSASGAA
jgi:hypothetical protein